MDTVARYAADGWAIAGDPRTLIGRLAALTAGTACVPFVAFDRVPQCGGPVVGPPPVTAAGRVLG